MLAKFAMLLALLMPWVAHADVHDGSFSAKATLGAASFTQIYRTTSVTPNTNYTASIWVKGTGALTFIVNNPAWTYFPASTTINATGTWTKVTLPTFSSGANNQLVFRFYDEVGSTPGSIAYLDDGFLGLSGGSNLLGNAGFESGSTGWTVGSAFAIGQFPGAPLADGTYTLAPANATGTRLNVTGAGTANGTNVDMVTSSGAANQQWIFTNVGGSTYRISPAHAPSAGLDVNGQLTTSGTNVQIWSYLGQANQRWTLSAVSGGYTLTPTHATALRLNTTGTSSGSNVNVTTANGASAQTWNIVAAGSLPATPTGLSATAGNAQVALSWTAATGASSYSVFRGTTSNGQSATAIATNISTTSYTDTGRTNGTTYFYKVQAVNSFGSSGNSNEASATPVGSALANGTYTLAPANATATRLNVAGSGTTDGTNVDIVTANGAANQQWIFTNVSGSTYRISPAHAPNQALDVNGQLTASGTNVQTWTYLSQANQRWTLTTVAGGYTLTPTHATALRLNATGSATGSNVNVITASGSSTQTWNIAPSSTPSETIGGGTISSPANGPAASFGLGAGATLVKNWNFGANGTIKNYTDMSANFYYHDQFNTIGNGTNYGGVMVSPDSANAISGQPIEGVNCPVTRTWSADAMRTLLVPLNGATTIVPSSHNLGSGSFMAKFTLPNGGSLLNQDIVWETRVRMVTPPYFWFAIWTAGNQWDDGAEEDVVESFGWDKGGTDTNYEGDFWHSNSVGGTDTDAYSSWESSMAAHGITNFDATQYHVWTWVYRKNNTYSVYMDGIQVNSGSINWTLGGAPGGTPINMYFLFDATWAHVGIAEVNHNLPASAFSGKYYEWDYSRVYLKP